MKKSVLALGLSVALLSGCVISVDEGRDGYDSGSSWAEREEDNRQQISRLDIGASVNSVRNAMGVPDFDELLQKDGKEHRVLFYRTQRNRGDGATTKDECTPIVFVDGQLIGFGESALNAL